MKRFLVAAALAACVATPVRAGLVISVTNEASEEARGADFVAQFLPLVNHLKAALHTEVTMVFSQNLTQELQKTRSGTYALLLGPAHVVGSALRYGYEPVGSFAGEERMQFIVPAHSPIKSLEEAQGKRLGLPASDSLATYLAMGEFNARGWTTSRFKEVRNFRLHEIVLHSLEIGVTDIGVVDERAAKKWLAKNEGRVIFETKAVPSLGIAVQSSLDKDMQAKIRDALLKGSRPALAHVAAVNNLGELRPMARESYNYVSTLGYFTPTVLAGVKIVTAEEAQALVKKGATFFDVRTDREYREKHCKDAILLPYVEKSKKEVGFDMGQDEFKLTEAAKDKSAPLVFACNGAECWKSYKASVWAHRHGYTNVHWFRGGLPEWRAKGLPLGEGAKTGG